MTTPQKPVFMVHIECPICKSANEFESLKVGAYTETGRDTDFCPMGRTWVDPSYQIYNPLLFNFATCPNCYYSRELSSTYKEWSTDNNFKNYKLPSIKAKHLQELAKSDSVLKYLGSAIKQESYPFESAVIKLLLTIYEELLSDKPSNLDIARFFVRVGWLFREHDGGKSELPYNVLIGRLEIELSRLNEFWNLFNAKLAPIKNIVLTDPVMEKWAEADSTLADNLRGCAGRFEENAALFKAEMDKLKSIIDNMRIEAALKSPSSGTSNSFGKHASFSEFLMQVKKQWSEIPLNEIEALSRAVDHYLKSYQSSREIRKGLQQLQAAYLIAELSRRASKHELAMEYFKITMREAHALLTDKGSDKSTQSGARKILDMALEQARLSKAFVEA